MSKNLELVIFDEIIGSKTWTNYNDRACVRSTLIQGKKLLKKKTRPLTKLLKKTLMFENQSILKGGLGNLNSYEINELNVGHLIIYALIKSDQSFN
jgi:hypothetical protein